MDITEVVKAAITLIMAVLTTFVVPYIKQRTDEHKLTKIITIVDIAVQAAEQIGKNCGYDSVQKKQYVVAWLAEKGYTVDETLDNYIEAAVLRLHDSLYGQEELV